MFDSFPLPPEPSEDKLRTLSKVDWLRQAGTALMNAPDMPLMQAPMPQRVPWNNSTGWKPGPPIGADTLQWLQARYPGFPALALSGGAQAPYLF